MEEQKHTAEDIMAMVNQLPIMERIRFQKLFKDAPIKAMEIEEYLTEQRFSSGRVCPICGGTHVRRNGKRKNGSQKFICVDCKKTFSIRKNSIFSGTRKPMAIWHEYMVCMAEGLTLDESAERCGISHKTAFTWRHKILDAMSKSDDECGLEGIVEADETFLTVSYKGDAAKFSSGEINRKARKHGGGNHKRGLSDELVCIPCAVDRKGNAVSKVAKLGKCSSEALESVLGGRISAESTLCSDEDKSYRKFSKHNNLKLVQIKGGKSVKGIFHIQHLNAYHSKLKTFVASFKGISSKYLNNYLVWNNAVEHKGGTLREKTANILNFAASALFEETCLAVPMRPAIPLLVKNQS